jgi:hypothetical protein
VNAARLCGRDDRYRRFHPLARYLAIDGDHAPMHVAAASVSRGSVKVEKAITWIEAQPITSANAAEMGKRLKERLKEAGFAPAPVLVCIGRDRVIVKEVKYPPTPPADEPAVVRFQASKELTESPDEVVIDYFPLPAADANGERRAAVVVVRRDVVQAYQALCAAAGLRLSAITPRPVATVAALQRAIATGAVNPVESLSAAVAVLTRGERWAELSIARGGQVVFTRTLSGPALTSETALLGELRRNLTVYAGQNPQNQVQALYVAEADSPGGWSGRVRAGLSVPVYAFDPLAGVPSDTTPEHRGAFAGLSGMFALFAQAAEVPINFAAPREPKPPKDPNKRLVALAAPIMVLLLGAGIGWGIMLRMDKEKEIARLINEKTSLDQDLAKYEEDSKRIKALDDWIGRGVVLEDEIYDLVCRFPDPAGTRLQTLTINAREPEKNAKTRYVSHIEMKVETEDGKAIDRMLSEMVKDRHYRVDPKEPKGASGFGSTRFNQVFMVRADVEHRSPKEYIRTLNVSPPPRRDRAAEELKVNLAPAPFVLTAPGGEQ